VVELKEKESEPELGFDSEHNKGKHIIDVEPTTTIMTTTIQPEEPEEPEEGEHLFHSHMWVKGTPLHFIVDNGSQKNLISAKVFKILKLHPQPYTIGWLIRDETSMSASSVTYPTTSSPSRMRYCVMFPHLKSVMFF
jgi:hypothetical protein